MRTVVSLCAVVWAALVLAQGGSPLTESAYTLAPEKVSLTVDGRFWDGGGNWSASALLRLGVDERTEIDLSYVDFDIEGDDPIGKGETRAVRASDYSAVGVRMKVHLWDTHSPAVALLLGADLPTSRRRAVNTVTGGYGMGDGAIGVVGLAFQWGDNEGRWRWILQPQLTMFDDEWRTNTGERIKGFGNVLGLSLGVRYRVDSCWTAFGDVTAILSGDNSIDEDTGQPDDEVVWAAGITWRKPDSRWQATIFATDSSGASPATAVLATPDGDAAFGVGFSVDF